MDPRPAAGGSGASPTTSPSACSAGGCGAIPRRAYPAPPGRSPKSPVSSASQTTILGGTDARESVVQGLARSGRLKGSATSTSPPTAGRPRGPPTARPCCSHPTRTARRPPALETDGGITAEQIVRTWDLDADLVVLSACESGLGRDAGGEGYLGFAQALFAKGARSLVLSQWKVDDKATSLLMARFYQNLLGKRPGQADAQGRGAARGQGVAARRRARGGRHGASPRLPRGTIVRRGGGRARAARARPYENPTYWAGFILIGSPD